jgi:hypothetical protein
MRKRPKFIVTLHEKVRLYLLDIRRVNPTFFKSVQSAIRSLETKAGPPDTQLGDNIFAHRINGGWVFYGLERNNVIRVVVVEPDEQ